MDENTLLLGKFVTSVAQEGENMVKGAKDAEVKILFFLHWFITKNFIF